MYLKRLLKIGEAVSTELRAVLGVLITPGTLLFFIGFFLFVLFNNFLGLFPYVFTCSRHLSFTLRLGLPLWLGSMLIRIKVQVEANLAHLVPEGTPGALMPVMVMIETVRLIIRPGTLSVRLAANMVAGHLLLALLGGQGANIGGLLLGAIIIGLCALVTLECAVACIQAYVFIILRSLYLGEHSRKAIARLGHN